MKKIMKAALVGYERGYKVEGESPFGSYITMMAPSESSESFLIAELEVEVDMPDDSILQQKAIQALQRVRAVEMKNSMEKLDAIDAKIQTLQALENQPEAAQQAYDDEMGRW